MHESALEKKSSLKMLGCLSLLNWLGLLHLGTLILSMKFCSLDIALYFYESTTQSWLEYCCHVCAGTPSLLILGYVRWVTEKDI